jgi:hypothetical protein
MAEHRAFGFVLGVTIASLVAAGAMFWIGRKADGRGVHAYTEVDAYCAARVQSVQGDERGLRETACRLTLAGALDSLAAHHFVDSVDQVRAVDALLRDVPPILAKNEDRAPAAAKHRQRPESSGDLFDPFTPHAKPASDSTPTATSPTPTRSQAGDLTDPFAGAH